LAQVLDPLACCQKKEGKKCKTKLRAFPINLISKIELIYITKIKNKITTNGGFVLGIHKKKSLDKCLKQMGLELFFFQQKFVIFPTKNWEFFLE
jgi:hypothetical protein